MGKKPFVLTMIRLLFGSSFEMMRLAESPIVSNRNVRFVTE